MLKGNSGSTVAEHSTYNPQIEYLNPAAVLEERK